MEKIIVNGGRALHGAVRISGGKNSSLAIITAACLAADVSVLENVPQCRDVLTLKAILEALGARIELDRGRMAIDARALASHAAPYDLCRQMRASFYAAGLLLGRGGRAQIPLAGGGVVGSRPVEFYIRGFAAHGASYAITPDRLEAGTYLLAAAATGGNVLVEQMIPEHISALLAKLEEAGAIVERGTDGVRVRAGGVPRGVHVDTAPYPGFATDLHPPFVALMSRADGQSRIRETVFESRFGYVDELRRMGADVHVEGDSAIVNGVPYLTGAPVEAVDIRAGATIIIAALSARGTSEIAGVDNVDRGYEQLDGKLSALGADVRRVEVRGESVPQPVA